jgi:2'-5' RNA ligase
MNYSLVTYLDDAATQYIRSIQQKLAEVTGSRASLEEWEPHVTIGDGITISKNELPDVEQKLAALAASEQKFSVAIRDFTTRDNRQPGLGEVTTPYVLLSTVDTNEQLVRLEKVLREQVTSQFKLWWQMRRPYLPHVTLAFRDLQREGYESGIRYLESVEIGCTVWLTHIALVEKRLDKDVEYKRFNFADPHKP